jgi:YidC/Oxa1 family membrane protein insertase
LIQATIPIISPLFKGLLDTIGWVLAWLYQVVPNYGVAIIILTVLLRVLVLPLGVKQIKSMGTMQALAPKIADIKKKYKGNSAKIQEETMRLYKEVGVNPLGGCLPMLLSFPVLIAMYAVLKPPALTPTPYLGKSAYSVSSHLPADSTLFINVLEHQDTLFTPGVNLECSPRDSGKPAVVIYDTSRKPVTANQPFVRDGQPVKDSSGQTVLSRSTFNCGSGVTSKIPYFVLLALMIGTTFFQQYQMTRVSPPGSQSQQQQTILRVMPLMFGFIGFSFPAGVVLYWTVANGFQIGQQYVLLRAGHIGPEAVERQIAKNRAKQASEPTKPQKKGWMASMMERADQERKRKGQTPPRKPPPRSTPKGGGSKGTGTTPSKGGGSKGGTPKGGTGRGGPKGSGSTPRRSPPGRPKPKKPDAPDTGGSDGS